MKFNLCYTHEMTNMLAHKVVTNKPYVTEKKLYENDSQPMNEIKKEPNLQHGNNCTFNGILIKKEIQYDEDEDFLYDNDDNELKIDESSLLRVHNQSIKSEPIDDEEVDSLLEVLIKKESDSLYEKEHFSLDNGYTNNKDRADNFVNKISGDIIEKVASIKKEEENVVINAHKDFELNSQATGTHSRTDDDTTELKFVNMNSDQMVNVFMKINPKTFNNEKPKRIRISKQSLKISKGKQTRPTKSRGDGNKLRKEGHFVCDLCGRRFGVRQSLIRHLEMPHIEPRAQLTHPLATSLELTAELIRSELENLTRHGKEVDRKCIVCLKCFDRKGCAKRHLLEHIVANCRALNCYQCPLCNEAQFARVDDFKHHMRIHASLTSYKCRICNKSFGDSSNFSKHKKVHGSTHGQCSICRRKFRTAKMMELHMEHHEHTKPIKCPKCDRIFYFESLLKKHLKSSHHHNGNGKSFRCTMCNQPFISLKEKWHHQWLVHAVRKRSADCWLCDSRFRIVTELKKHLTINHNLKVTCKKIKQNQSV